MGTVTQDDRRNTSFISDQDGTRRKVFTVPPNLFLKQRYKSHERTCVINAWLLLILLRLCAIDSLFIIK